MGENLDQVRFTGLHKPEIRVQLGDPDTIEVMTKTQGHIFGYVEGLWDKMELGDSLVTWTYEAKNGKKMLYFINESTEVIDESFWFNDQKKNPVY